jgi:hypothetical protein
MGEGWQVDLCPVPGSNHFKISICNWRCKTPKRDVAAWIMANSERSNAFHKVFV